VTCQIKKGNFLRRILGTETVRRQGRNRKICSQQVVRIYLGMLCTKFQNFRVKSRRVISRWNFDLISTHYPGLGKTSQTPIGPLPTERALLCPERPQGTFEQCENEISNRYLVFFPWLWYHVKLSTRFCCLCALSSAHSLRLSILDNVERFLCVMLHFFFV